MASENGEKNGDNGSKDRATVALVDAKVDGLKDLIRAEFATVKEDVRALASVVADVVKQGLMIEQLHRRVQKLEDGNAGQEHERRIVELEKGKHADREWRRVNLPTILVSAAIALAAIIGAVSQLH